jgi:hypothetical protein
VRGLAVEGDSLPRDERPPASAVGSLQLDFLIEKNPVLLDQFQQFFAALRVYIAGHGSRFARAGKMQPVELGEAGVVV